MKNFKIKIKIIALAKVMLAVVFLNLCARGN